MNPCLFVGWVIIAVQIGIFLYTSDWYSFSWFHLAAGFFDPVSNSWLGLKMILTYVPVSGILLIIGLSQRSYELEKERLRNELLAKQQAEDEWRRQRS